VHDALLSFYFPTSEIDIQHFYSENGPLSLSLSLLLLSFMCVFRVLTTIFSFLFLCCCASMARTALYFFSLPLVHILSLSDSCICQWGVIAPSVSFIPSPSLGLYCIGLYRCRVSIVSVQGNGMGTEQHSIAVIYSTPFSSPQTQGCVCVCVSLSLTLCVCVCVC
jgi:hypothetical protein